jgi:hypothetical protein
VFRRRHGLRRRYPLRADCRDAGAGRGARREGHCPPRRDNEAIASFENDVGSALHNLKPGEADQIESYAYVELNLEAAHERLNTVFMMAAVSIYVDSPTDQDLLLHVMHGQLLSRSRNYLDEKKDAIASMAAAHPDNTVFAEYSRRANALLGDRAIPLLDELERRLGAPR